MVGTLLAGFAVDLPASDLEALVVAGVNPHLLSSKMLPSILHDVFPDENEFSCRQWLPSKERWCLNQIEKVKDRPKAARLAQSLRDSDPSQLSIAALEELAGICYCKRWHRGDAVKLRDTAQFWFEELRERHKSSLHNESRSTSNPPLPSHLPRPHRPVTRSMTVASHKSSSHNQRDRKDFDDGLPQFSSYKPQIDTDAKVNTMIAQKVQQKLGLSDSEAGYIYIFTRPQSPGFVKIGFSRDPERRLRQWAAQCGYQPVLGYTSPRSSNARRIEQLVFAELSTSRQRERCMNGSGCGREHREWFEIDVKTARESVEHWTKWIHAKPYDANGELCRFWAQALGFSPGEKASKAAGSWHIWIDCYRPKVRWAIVWESYSSRWNTLYELAKAMSNAKANARKTLLDNVLLWPVESGRLADVTEGNIMTFLQKAPLGLDPSLHVHWLTVLKTERIRWHPDKIQQRYGRLGIDGKTLAGVTAVAQAMNKLWEDRHILKSERCRSEC